MLPRFQNFTIKVRYSVRDAGYNANGRRKGLGLFAEEPIKKGQPVYGNWSEPKVARRLVVIPYSALEVMKSVAAEFPKDIVNQLFEWCEDNWISETDGLLCEMDAERYVNHDSRPNMDTCSYLPAPYNSSFPGQCALRDIAPGEELTENYKIEVLDTEESESFQAAVKRFAGAHARHDGECPASAQD